MITKLLLDWEKLTIDNRIRYGIGTGNWRDASFKMEKSMLHTLHGNFAMIEDEEKQVVLVSDVIRSIPIFYQVCDETIYISDNAEKIQHETKAMLSPDNETEFLQTGYVTENETIFKDIFQIYPGEIVRISKQDGKISKEFYFELLYTCDSTQTQEQLINELDETMVSVFEDLIKRLKGRTALLPLSSGCDSRTVAVMLKRLGYENVICFSYGRNDNFEAVSSKEVADSLGYKWLFVEYNASKWKSFYDSSEYEEFLKYSCRGSGIGCVQAIIAIMELKNKGLVPDDAVVVPGHALDFLAGSHLPLLNEGKKYEKQYFVDEIIARHYVLQRCKKANTEKWNEKLSAHMTELEIVQNIIFWQWKNRQSKFIANDVRAYEYTGFAWDMPLWDIRLCKFWMKVPYSYLYGRKLQYLYMEQIIDPNAKMKHVYNYQETTNVDRPKVNFKQKIKQAFPWLIGIRGFWKQYRGSSNAFYDHLSKWEYLNLVRKFGLQFNLNSVVADKYIFMINESLEKG